MKILALDTSTEVCSVALQSGDELLTRFDDSGRKNTDIILPFIDELMAEAGLKPQQLDLIAFGRGPGSFTGVRVATGIAQGIAFAADLPVAPVSTLAMLAQGAFEATAAQTILTINDARMKEVYAAAYRFEASADFSEILAECVCKPADLEYCHPEQSGSGVEGARPLIVGTGFGAYAEVLQDKFPATAWDINQMIKPHARHLIPIALQMQARDQLVSAEQALPVYLRDNVAKKKGER